jgi:hypothetical protein
VASEWVWCKSGDALLVQTIVRWPSMPGASKVEQAMQQRESFWSKSLWSRIVIVLASCSFASWRSCKCRWGRRQHHIWTKISTSSKYLSHVTLQRVPLHHCTNPPTQTPTASCFSAVQGLSTALLWATSSFFVAPRRFGVYPHANQHCYLLDAPSSPPEQSITTDGE